MAASRRRRRAILGGLTLAGGLAVQASLAGCGDDARDLFVVTYDAGADADGAARQEDGATVDPTLGGPCTDDAQCDDRIPCTFDRCEKALSRCRNTPDDAQCADPLYCNGAERCVVGRGCAPGAVVTCQDGDGCTIDRCIESTRSCEHVPRDSDGDGDPDDHCYAKRDCNDNDPSVSSQRAEVCGNLRDDNCNGAIDETPCTVPANDDCSVAQAITAPGSFVLSTAATKKDYATTCSVENTSAARDVVVAITVPGALGGAGARDVVVRAVTPNDQVALTLEGACGVSASELACAAVAASDARTIARSVPAGTTIWAIITTQSESRVDLRVDFAEPTTKPTNESCVAPRTVPTDTGFAVSLTDAQKDLPSDCASATGDLTYAFDLPSPRDVRIFASTTLGRGTPIVSLRDASCTGELRCRANGSAVFVRSLPAGRHVLAVAGTTQIDASIVVRTYPPTTAPPEQSCSTAPAILANVTVDVDLSQSEDATKNGCSAGGPNAAYALTLTAASDVLLVGRFPRNENGAISLNASGCTTEDLLSCSQTGGTPRRSSSRNVPAGSYRVVVSDELGLPAQLMALVRPTVPPVTVTSDGCADAHVIPETGGYFTGDTTNATAQFDAGCDSGGQPLGGAKDQLLRLTLTETRRVVFDTSGSVLQTLLDVRTGAACPGIEVAGGCNVEFGPNRSFLDLTLDPGTYWIQVDGYGGQVGAWNLDVRVLPP